MHFETKNDKIHNNLASTVLSDLNNYAWPSKWRYASETVNDVNASCDIISPQQAVSSMSKRSFRWWFM